MKSKKAQFDFPLITFVILIFGLLLISPIILKIFHSIQTPISNQLSNVSGGEIAAANFNKVMDTATNFWDKVVLAAFMLSVILLVISAFMIDTNPFFIILYIFISFMLMLFAPNIIDSLGAIYDSANFTAEVAQLTLMDYLRIHFGEFLVGIFVITGIIMYGKIWLFPSRAGVRS